MWCILLVGFALAGCSGAGPNQLGDKSRLPDPQDKDAWNARFSPSSYVTAWGVSNESARQAEQDARAGVAASVRSSIESELLMVMESESINGQSSDYQKLESITKTRTYFEHAELIRLVPQTAHKSKGEYWVMAALSRRDAVDELLVDYNREATTFRHLAARLDSLMTDPPAFTITWKKLQDFQKTRLPQAAEIRAVAGGWIPEIVADNSRYENAEASRYFLMENLQLVVNLEQVEDGDIDELSSQISAALASLGLTVATEGCTPGAIHMKLHPDFQWTNVMGRVVQLDLDGEIGFCEEDEPWSVFQISDPRMRGEGRKPMDDLYGRMNPKFLEERFFKILNPFLPLQ